MLKYDNEVLITMDNKLFKLNPTFRRVFKSILVGYSDLPLENILKIQMENLIINKEDILTLSDVGIVKLQNKMWEVIADLSDRDKLYMKSAKDFNIEKSFDYISDYKYYRPSFLSEYGIDLENNDTLMWNDFKDLFSALSDKSRMKTVIHVRTMKTPSLSKDPE